MTLLQYVTLMDVCCNNKETTDEQDRVKEGANIVATCHLTRTWLGRL